MIQHRSRGRTFWVLPGGGVDDGERPRDAVIRELQEECHVEGTIIRLVGIQDLSRVAHAEYEKVYTYLVDVGEQTPRLGTDPELENRD
jgi:ADP-ribose pyrophosphatase YjhB (NUDIX family)